MDNEIRIHAFNWLEEMVAIHGDVLARKILEKGFYFRGERITLLGPRGIWKPKIMQLPISITTISGSSYEDKYEEGGFLDYKFRGANPFHSDNVGLRKIMDNKIPIIYFLSVVKGLYLANWPVFIQAEDRQNLSFKVALEDSEFINKNVVNESDLARRDYLTSKIKVRLHQRTFREKVLAAYNTQCTLCKLAHKELLDAAHIIPDSEEDGKPIISNGLSLCKIHHAAYDTNIIGISPDYEIHVRNDILQEIDGPMLKYGIQNLNNQKIILPKRKQLWPEKERLDYRFQKFKNVI
jgi:putative restriction endonuclease